MSGGGSQVTSSTPWQAAQPYLQDIMSKASGLYGQTSGNFTPDPSFNYGALTSSLGKYMSGQPDYTAVSGAVGAANDQQWNDFYNKVVPSLNAKASFLQNPTGSIKDLNSAVTNLTNNQSWNAQQQYLGQYDLARQQGLQADQMYPQISQLPQQNLADYASIISNTGGRFGNGSTSLNPGAGGTASNIIGGLTAGTGLLNNLGNLYNNYFGGDPAWSGVGNYDAGGVTSLTPAGTDTGLGSTATYGGASAGGPLYSGASNAGDFSGSYPTVLGNTTDVGAGAGAGDVASTGGGLGSYAGPAAGAGTIGAGTTAGGAAGAGADAALTQAWSQPVAYDAAQATAADAGGSAAGSAGGGLGAAGTVGIAATAFALQAAMYQNDPVGSPHDQANLLLSSMQRNPYPPGTQNYQNWQNFTGQMQQWVKQHGDLNGFWESQGLNVNVPGGPAQPAHTNVQN